MVIFWKRKSGDEESKLAEMECFKPIIQFASMPELEQQMKLIGIDEKNLRYIKSYQPAITAGVSEITDVFYENVLAVPSLKK